MHLEHYTIETLRLRSFPISPLDKALLLTLAHLADPLSDTVEDIASKQIAEGLGWTTIATKESLARLEALDLIVVSDGTVLLNRPVIHAHKAARGVLERAVGWADSYWRDAYESRCVKNGCGGPGGARWMSWIIQGMTPAKIEAEAPVRASKAALLVEECMAGLEIPDALNTDRVRDRVRKWLEARAGGQKSKWTTMKPKNISNALSRVRIYPEAFIYELLETAAERQWLGLDQAAVSTYENWKRQQRTLTNLDSGKDRIDRARAQLENAREMAQTTKLAMENIMREGRTAEEKDKPRLREEYRRAEKRWQRYVGQMEDALGVLKLAGVR